jgi:hypothetical protein
MGWWPTESARELQQFSRAHQQEDDVMSKTLWSGVLATVGLMACSAPETPAPGAPGAPPNVVCTTEARPAITVEPVDAATGQSISQGATLIAMTGTYTDTASVHTTGEPTISAAHERPGTYTVIVRHPDYRNWERSNILVGRDECHVQTIRLKAEMQKR